MAFCNNCGTQIGAGAKFCPSCGSTIGDASQQQAPGYQQQAYQQQTYQQAGQDGDRDAADNKAMGVLAYLGILVLVPIFAAKESRFARYHANQGLVLAIVEVAYALVVSILTAILTVISWRVALTMSTIFGLVWLGFLALIIIGIINAASGKMKPLPVFGKITILK